MAKLCSKGGTLALTGLFTLKIIAFIAPLKQTQSDMLAASEAT